MSVKAPDFTRTTQQFVHLRINDIRDTSKSNGGVLGNPVSSRDLSPYRSTSITDRSREVPQRSLIAVG